MGGKVPGAELSIKSCFFPPCQCKGMRQHKAKMVAAVTVPLPLAQLFLIFLHTVFCRHVGIWLWLPGNPGVIGKRYDWDNGLRGRRSLSKWPPVIKTIHSLLCGNRKQKHLFCLVSGTSCLASWDLVGVQG